MAIMSDINQTSPRHQASSADQMLREESRTWKDITAALAGDLSVFGLDIAWPMQLSW